MNNKKYALRVIFGLILLTIVIMFTFSVFPCGEQLKINDYFQFSGSLFGAIIGAMVSFEILNITSKNQKEEFERRRKIDEHVRREDMLNSSRPVLKVSICFNIDANRTYFYEAEKSGTKSYNYVSLKFINIGTGPARNISIKINNNDVTRSSKIKEKFDLGVGEIEVIKIITDYNKILREGIEGNKEAELYIACRDIYDERCYEYNIKLINEKDYTGIETVEMIEEKIIEIRK
ncbi:hypothetical protein [Clostridium cadaveris]|uniref:hypothetical protein n=1 Tax=Clostridium cadaveris TaxID=1529 RepID=UPI0015B718D2|nr:hypothetical protein [Clostridium cadaveris]NWK12941.1 hypothetical protein [Clostridium cadaveris]